MKTVEKPMYHKPELDAWIQEHLKETEQRIIINAQNYAVRNRPPLLTENMQVYFHEDHVRFQAMIDTVGGKLQFNALCNEVAEHDRLTEGQLQAIHNKLSLAKENQIEIDRDLRGNRPPYGKFRLLLVWVAIGAIALFEGLLATPCFETWGYSLTETLCMGVLFAGVLAALAHAFERIVFLGKTPWQRRIITAALLLLLGCLFGYMSQARAEYLSKQIAANSADAINMHFSPWPFVLTSLLLFVVAVALNHFFLPSNEQRKAMREYNETLKKKSSNEAEQQQLEQDIANRKKENAELRQTNASILEYGCMLEQLIISHAHGGFALWKKHNMMYRPDNDRPTCFDDHSYPFAFNTNFHPIKSLQK
jgi:hypothetical protein